ncbi:glycosyltransferase [Butyrivibrio sp. AC2005]|uniref:glycosyltransferase n=1 Tax=Butyrivibrio sp. AC2005 TaxID=1280672 RepID=UPI0003FE0D27|nr:glycosyltransferase [Butyrivibrio sp. AC2005]
MSKILDRPLITVIMPSYNVSNYIEECLLSVIGQTLHEIEILCIDAGSTDGTREIIKKYEKIDNRIKLIDSEKKSVGYQENIGIASAKGEYIGFVETDDYICEDMYEKLYKHAKALDVEFVKCDYFEFVTTDYGKCCFGHRISKSIGAGEIINPSVSPEKRVVDSTMWNGIYNTAFLRRKNIKLNETPGAAYQDIGFVLQVYLNSERASYINESLYFYRKDSENASVINPHGLLMIYRELQYCKEYLKNYVSEDSWWWIVYYERLLGGSVSSRIIRYLDNDDGKCDELYSTLELVRDEYIEGIERGFISATYTSLNNVFIANLLKDSIEIYLRYYDRIRIGKKNYIKDLVEKVINSENTIIFGAGNWGKLLYLLLKKNDADSKVTMYLDNDEKKWGRELFDKPIYSLESKKNESRKSLIIIANGPSRFCIYRQLISEGVSEKSIILFQPTGLEIR